MNRANECLFHLPIQSPQPLITVTNTVIYIITIILSPKRPQKGGENFEKKQKSVCVFQIMV